MYLMQAIPAAIFLIALIFIPESPRYLVSKGRDESAESVLTKLFGSATARAKLDEIRVTFSEDHRPRFRDLKGNGLFGIRPIVWAGIGLAVFQQLVGINVIFYYSSVLWQSVGITQSNSLLISVSTSIVNIVGTLIAILLIDRIGRKPLALIGSAGMAVSLGL